MRLLLVDTLVCTASELLTLAFIVQIAVHEDLRSEDSLRMFLAFEYVAIVSQAYIIVQTEILDITYLIVNLRPILL
jgi:hypothetical protein